jgi:exonuclease VII small subunit
MPPAQGRRAGHAGRRHHRQRDPCPRGPRAQSHAGRGDHAGGHEYLARLHTDSTASIPGRRAGRQLRRYQLSPRQRTPSGQQRRTEGLRLAQHSGRDPHQQRLHQEVNADAQGRNHWSIRSTPEWRHRGRVDQRPRTLQQDQNHCHRSETITGAIAQGKGSLGKLINDDTLYTRANSAVDRLDKITIALDEGKGSAGKLLKDDSLYNNLNAAVANTNQLVAEINAGKGAWARWPKTRPSPQKLDDTVTRLDSILKGVDEGKGTLGQLVQNRSLYDHADQTLDQAQQLVKSIREDPKKYLVIRMKVF